jgi:hypothetical protein
MMVNRDNILIAEIAIGMILTAVALLFLVTGMIDRDGYTLSVGGFVLFIGVLLLVLGLLGWKK